MRGAWLGVRRVLCDPEKILEGGFDRELMRCAECREELDGAVPSMRFCWREVQVEKWRGKAMVLEKIWRCDVLFLLLSRRRGEVEKEVDNTCYHGLRLNPWVREIDLNSFAGRDEI